MSDRFAHSVIPLTVEVVVVFTIVAALIAVMAGAARRRLGIDARLAMTTAASLFVFQQVIFVAQLLLGLDVLWAAISAGVIGSVFIGHVPQRRSRWWPTDGHHHAGHHHVGHRLRHPALSAPARSPLIRR